MNVAKKKAPDARGLEIAARMKALREAVGMTQEQVAEAAGIARTEVVQVEKGLNKLSTARMREGLARAFRVNTYALADYVEGTYDLETLLAGRATGSRGATLETGYAARKEAVSLLVKEDVDIEEAFKAVESVMAFRRGMNGEKIARLARVLLREAGDAGEAEVVRLGLERQPGRRRKTR